MHLQRLRIRACQIGGKDLRDLFPGTMVECIEQLPVDGRTDSETALIDRFIDEQFVHGFCESLDETALLLGISIASRVCGVACADAEAVSRESAGLVADLIGNLLVGGLQFELLNEFQMRFNVCAALKLAIGPQQTQVGGDDKFRTHGVRVGCDCFRTAHRGHAT